MNLLIDAGVLVGLEDDDPVGVSLASLVRKSNRHGVGLMVHEASKEGLEGDGDAHRRRVRSSKIRKFTLLAGVPTPGREDLASLYGALDGPGDVVAAHLLHALASDAVDLLVSEDPGIHRRAKASGLEERVLNVAEAVAWMERTYEPRTVSLPQIEEVPAYRLVPSDPIFDELRGDYPGFDDWMAKARRDHRPCWVIRVGDRLACLVIRKEETRADAGTVHPGPRILKVCTFKVAADHRGRKLGEQLLKQVLWHAQSNGHDLVYLTAFPKHESLLMLLEAYGFVRSKVGRDGQVFMEKAIVKGDVAPVRGETVLDAATRAYPRFRTDRGVGKYVVPIKPRYHELLFPEFQGMHAAPGGTGRPGNTIEKVYLSRAKTRTIHPGDVVLFYMSRGPGVHGSQSMTTVGVVKSVRWSADIDEIKRWTAKRSAYSDDELRELLAEKDGPLLIIDFLLTGHLTDPVPLRTLMAEAVLTGWPQSIVRLDEDRFRTLRGLARIAFEA